MPFLNITSTSTTPFESSLIVTCPPSTELPRGDEAVLWWCAAILAVVLVGYLCGNICASYRQKHGFVLEDTENEVLDV